jgi:pilus assembly protein Flp/PilA
MLKNWFKDESGQGMVEYGLIIGLIAIVVIVGLIALGPKIRELFTKTAEIIPEVTTAAP